MRLLDPNLIDDPYLHYAAWREESPIFRDDESGAWVLTRHDDVHMVLRDAAAFSSSAMGRGDNPLPLLMDDPPRHTKLRGLVNKAFTSRMLKSMEGNIEAIADRLLADVEACVATDIVQKLTIPLPVQVISTMMGIPLHRSEDFKRWSDALTGTLAGASLEDRQQDIFEMAGFFQSLIPERRENPGDDLVSAIVNAEIDGEQLSDQDIVGFSMLLLIAGNETTTNLLGNFLNLLIDRPDLWVELREKPALVEAGIEETLRFDGPVQFLMRQVKQPFTIHGQEVTRGETVNVIMGSANRDPRIYDNPDEFLLHRAKNRHHTFGYGIHFCIGAPLARLEAKVSMQALLKKFPSVKRGEGENERVQSHLLRGFHHLWVEFGMNEEGSG